MNPFRYERAVDVASAVSAIASEPGAAFLAGGTNILDFMKEGVVAPSLLIDVNHLPLPSLEMRGSELFIGALTRLSDVASHPLVRESVPFLSQAIEQSASPQLRNMATLAGNLLQHTRCPYFRDVHSPCNRRVPESGCGAIGGVNRREAVLGTSERCIAAHASDPAVALCALDARIHASSAAGTRAIAFSDFFRLPGDTPQVTHSLERGELVTGITVPLLPAAKNSTYVKIRDRAQFDFALVSVAAALEIVDGSIGAARIALGGVGTVPWRAREAETMLKGVSPQRSTFEAAAETAMASARGSGENNFKIPLAKRVIVRALEGLVLP